MHTITSTETYQRLVKTTPKPRATKKSKGELVGLAPPPLLPLSLFVAVGDAAEAEDVVADMLSLRRDRFDYLNLVDRAMSVDAEMEDVSTEIRFRVATRDLMMKWKRLALQGCRGPGCAQTEEAQQADITRRPALTGGRLCGQNTPDWGRRNGPRMARIARTVTTRVSPFLAA